LKPLESAFEIAMIVVKHQQGIITPREQTILDDWLNESPENRELFEQICNSARIEKRMAGYSLIDWGKDYQHFVRKHHRKMVLLHYRRLLKYAALLILPLAIAASLLFTHFKREIPVISPGISRATLVLADGRSIELKQDSTYVISESDGSILKNDNGLISYRKTSGLSQSKKNLYNQIFVPRNGEYQLILEDGTKIWINSETNIQYPVSFNSGNRTVKLQGEAYFEVAHNPDKPFIVELDDAKVEVLGTSFDIKAYKEDISLTTTLAEGKVSFSSRSGDENFVLSPGEQFELDKTSGAVTKREVDVSIYTSWKDGRFAFRNQRVEDIFKTLTRWYDVEIVYQTESIKEKRFTGDLKRYDEFNKILEIMGSSDLIKFDFRDNKVIIKEI
jgi:ferric-dicitrate binding protein FerR (iron transport regulator)